MLLDRGKEAEQPGPLVLREGEGERLYIKGPPDPLDSGARLYLMPRDRCPHEGKQCQNDRGFIPKRGTRQSPQVVVHVNEPSMIDVHHL